MSDYVFNRESIRSFHFVDCQFNAQTGVASLVYAFDHGPSFAEQITFPGAPFVLNALQQQALTHALQTLHLIAGVSYYKAAVPETIVIDKYTIDSETADFLTSIYENGLGEFAYRNNLSLRGKIKFPHTDNTQPATPELGLNNHALVAIGGGKDSLVSIESLRRMNIPQTVTWIGSAPLIRSCAERTGLPLLNITRQLAPEMFAMNKQGALNGHIPVTAINSAY
jgi:hypothetical protein